MCLSFVLPKLFSLLWPERFTIVQMFCCCHFCADAADYHARPCPSSMWIFVPSQTVQECYTSFYLSLLSEHRYSFNVILSSWKPSRQHDQPAHDDTLVAPSYQFFLLGSFSVS